MAADKAKDQKTTSPDKDKKAKAVKTKTEFVGSMPDNELSLSPKWLIYSANDGYQSSQYAIFSLTNVDEVPIGFRLRTRDRLFPQFSQSQGFLDPQQTVEIICYIPSQEQWPRDISEFIGKVHKVVVESLVLPENMPRPEGRKEMVQAVKRLFHSTVTKAPLTRLYLKLKILLPIYVPPAQPNKSSAASSKGS